MLAVAARNRSAPRLSPSTIHAHPNPVAICSPRSGSWVAHHAERGVDVRPLGARHRQVVSLVRAAHALSRCRGEVREPSAVRVGRDVGVVRRLDRERPDAVEQPIPIPIDDDQRAADEPVDHVERRRARHAERDDHELDRVERRTARERGERPQALLIVGEEQVVAPPDRRAQRVRRRSCFRLVGSASTWKRSSSRRAISSTDKRPRARGRELDRERQPVEGHGTGLRRSPGLPGVRVARLTNSSTASSIASGPSSTRLSPSRPSGR